MVEKLFNWLRTRVFPEKSKQSLSPFNDREFQAIIYDKHERLKKAEEIVGKTPMEHIDYTIEHGLDEFNKAFSDEPTKPAEKEEVEVPPEATQLKMTDKRIPVLTIHSSSGGGIRLSEYTVNGKRIPSVTTLESYTITACGIRSKVIYSGRVPTKTQ